MECRLGNSIVSKDLITFRDMGYGQKLMDREAIHYDLFLSHDEFKGAVEDSYNKFVDETKEDDKLTNYLDSIGLYEIGYPDFNNIFKDHKELLGEIIKDYLYQQLLEKCTSQSSSVNWQFAINTIDQIIIYSDHVRISGEAYEILKSLS
ncbi:hypothetical protein ABER61_08495 [Brevibacillus formosus]|uniref:Uncharacterized protein n=2 Tax=Brevibacillus formosus TaxID=54913 RepID=A0A837KM51_9BACL|nr:hypothetical protein [Brevibacillus formosus]KLH97696.1 hypothetical protein AA984_17640 [Brevibacillus formosus]MED1957505.1 hypothetical protein [Brevibacillus formosus]PSJ98894.1 hypothetical protein C7R91_05760 [Brevibacillus formosus]GED57618.1 hypothetical protein BFO01nite_17500 [Brevibacillus formosus]